MFSDRCTSWCEEWFDCTFPCSKFLFTPLPVTQTFYHFSVEMEACPLLSKLLKLSPGHSPVSLMNVTDLVCRKKWAEGDRKGSMCPFPSKLQQTLPKKPTLWANTFMQNNYSHCVPISLVLFSISTKHSPSHKLPCGTEGPQELQQSGTLYSNIISAL